MVEKGRKVKNVENITIESKNKTVNQRYMSEDEVGSFLPIFSFLALLAFDIRTVFIFDIFPFFLFPSILNKYNIIKVEYFSVMIISDIFRQSFIQYKNKYGTDYI